MLKFSQKYHIPVAELDATATETAHRHELSKQLRRMLMLIMNSLPQELDALCLMGTGMDFGDLAV